MSGTPQRRRPKGLFVGLATVDVTYPVDGIPRRNEKISVPGQELTAGGPATNAAITFGFLGGRSQLVTAVGAHPLAVIVRRDLKQSAVRLYDIARGRKESPPISSIMVLRDTGERSVVSANAAVFSAVKIKFNPQWLQGVSILQVDGHYMPLCISAARAAHRRGIPVVLESGSWKAGMSELLAFIDIAICSDDFRPHECNSGKEALEFLQAQGIRKVAITKGASAIRFVDEGKIGKVAVEKIRAVDTLGAGDIFHGAFCYYACEGYEFRESLEAAARVASFSCGYLGTRAWMREYQRRESRGRQANHP
jgi:sugar/nucleoside kinase (ribokinase family)